MPAKSKSQQRLFGMIHAYKHGKLHADKNTQKRIERIADGISDEDARHFAETTHDGLPEKKAEDQMLEQLRKDALMKIAAGAITAAAPYYTLAKGDTMSSVANRYGTTVQELQKLNPDAVPTKLAIGSRLYLPVRRTSAGLTSSRPMTAPAKPASVPSAVKTNAVTPAAPAAPVAPVTPSTPKDRMNQVAKLLHDKFGNTNLEAGILANINRETGGSFSHSIWEGNKNKTLDVNNKQTGGYGLFQLTGNALTNYKNHIKSNNLQDSPQTQIDYVYSNYGPGRAGWKNHTSGTGGHTKEQLAEWWLKKVETPGFSINGGRSYNLKRLNRELANQNDFMKKNIRLVNGTWQSM